MTRHSRSLLSVALGVLLASIGCMRATASAEGAPLIGLSAGPPKLVVFIAVDQLRGDMLSRYSAELTGGYARLMRGAWFQITETAPGHASTMSGRFPRSTGITSNSTGVVDRNYRLLVGQPNEVGASPERFQGTTLFDWLAAKDPAARALSVSMKDRSAILMIGRAKQNVYWYSTSGSFTTSSYYRDTLPTWVNAFNARRIAAGYAGAEWRLLRDSTRYREPDAVPFENFGRDNTFPHRFPPDSAQSASYVRVTPTMDSITALFALEGLRQTGIGRGPHTDILAVSFSATDVIGHGYGPDSREAHDNELRLDRTIGWFLDSLYRMRDSASVIIALSADHGIQPIPEVARQRGEATGAQGLRVRIVDKVVQARAGLRTANVDTMALSYDGETLTLDRAALLGTPLKADSILDAFARDVRQVPGVLRVDRLKDIRKADFALDPIARRWSHQFPESSPVDLVITLTKYSLWVTFPATHGSPHDLDAHVPVILYGPGVKPGRYSSFTRVVDIAPTLAQILGVKPLEKLDGVVRIEALAR
jgi:predicted AlkP superfamily pyrophosphatase or phosphodiesterase